MVIFLLKIQSLPDSNFISGVIIYLIHLKSIEPIKDGEHISRVFIGRVAVTHPTTTLLLLGSNCTFNKLVENLLLHSFQLVFR